MVRDLYPEAMPHTLSVRLQQWMELALATPGAVGRLAIFQRGWVPVVHRSLNMFSLIVLGVGVT